MNEPLWHDVQVIAATAVWFIRTVEKLVVLVWQLLQSTAATGMCPVLTPLAVVPLWQVAQPLVMPVWLKVAPDQLVVLL